MLLNSLIIYILKNIRFLIVKNKILENLELQLLAITSLISFWAIFIFNTFQFELFIKSYEHLKFFLYRFWQLKIYNKSI